MKTRFDFSAKKLLWRTRQGVQAFGWPGGAAIALLVMCACFVFFVLNPLQDRIATLKSESATLRVLSKGKATEQKALNPADQLVEFYRFFPNQDSGPDWMGKVYAAASKQGLNLEQGEYRLSHDRDGKITRYDIVLPVTGGYVQIRKFIAQTLNDVPTLSLDGISFGRQKVDDPAVEAQLRFTLYLGRE